VGRREVVNEHLRTFAAKAGVEDGLALGDDGTCGVALGAGENAVEAGLEVIEEEGLILFHAKLGDLEPGAGADALQRLLALNAYGVETGGGVVGLDEETREVVLTFAWPFDTLDYAQFEGLIERLFSATSYLRERLAEATAAAADEGGREARSRPPSGAIWG